MSNTFAERAANTVLPPALAARLGALGIAFVVTAYRG